MIDHIYSLRKEFLIIGLTGRTGSGCSTVANILKTGNIQELKSNFKNFREGEITNQVRKDRIVNNYISKNWYPFTIITASNIIYYFAVLEGFDKFVGAVVDSTFKSNILENAKGEQNLDLKEETKRKKEWSLYVRNSLNTLKDSFSEFSDLTSKINDFLGSRGYASNPSSDDEKSQLENRLLECKKYLEEDLPIFRSELEKGIKEIDKDAVTKILQDWGNNLRKYKSISENYGNNDESGDATSTIASKINQFIKCLRKLNELNGSRITRIVIDALRNPFEILYFRERYSAFYCMSVNTPEEIRHNNLLKDKHYRYSEVLRIDEIEGEKKDLNNSYQEIDVIRCIQLSDIYLSHNGEPVDKNRELINQILTYISLILHPGLVPPSAQERCMQIAFTAKLNSGCLSRQVGAVVTDSNFSIKSIGWNSVPEGQVPCSLRNLDDLTKGEDDIAFSEFEQTDDKFQSHISKLHPKYTNNLRDKLNGLTLSYCFKNIYTGINPKQKNNQVHTRSLHAEENAFLQIAKYGVNRIDGGKLFTTASCCELCAKKAYHLGIKEIYYIDSYPGISYAHIFQNGIKDHRPKVILFSGAVGRAYVSLYNPFVPLKDEIEYLTGVKVGEPIENEPEKSKNK